MILKNIHLILRQRTVSGDVFFLYFAPLFLSSTHNLLLYCFVDIFPKVGDQLSVQKIKCRAGFKDPLFSCHLPARSLCEILYSCGNIGRPVHCECVSEFGYPEPNSVDGSNNAGFASSCSGDK